MEHKIERFAELVEALPDANRAILETLLDFLVKVDMNSAVNKMDSNNLATMFGPNLLRSKEENDMEKMLRDTAAIAAAVQILISQYFKIFRKEEPTEYTQYKATHATHKHTMLSATSKSNSFSSFADFQASRGSSTPPSISTSVQEASTSTASAPSTISVLQAVHNYYQDQQVAKDETYEEQAYDQNQYTQEDQMYVESQPEEAYTQAEENQQYYEAQANEYYDETYNQEAAAYAQEDLHQNNEALTETYPLKFLLEIFIFSHLVG
jgi:hypothetical protein